MVGKQGNHFSGFPGHVGTLHTLSHSLSLDGILIIFHVDQRWLWVSGLVLLNLKIIGALKSDPH